MKFDHYEFNFIQTNFYSIDGLTLLLQKIMVVVPSEKSEKL